MIDIGNTEFIVDVNSLSRRELERYASNLFDIWDGYIEQALRVPDYSISLDIEEGSIKGNGKIAAAVGALYLGIANYGSFMSGIQTISSQVSYVGNKLVENAVSPFDGDNVRTTYRNNGGALSQLNRLFRKVQNGELTAEQAMQKAENILGAEGKASPEFSHGLYEAFQTAPKYLKQMPLFEVDQSEIKLGHDVENKRNSPRTPTPKPEAPINQFRVEIWRESKRDKKNVRVKKLRK